MNVSRNKPRRPKIRDHNGIIKAPGCYPGSFGSRGSNPLGIVFVFLGGEMGEDGYVCDA